MKFLRSPQVIFRVPCLFLLLFVSNSLAQEDVIRVETNLIGFEVGVKDKNGKPVRGLDAKDFRMFEDGAERNFDFFEPLRKKNDSRPLAVVFALDTSGSLTADEFSRLRSAMKIFVERLSDYRSYFAVTTFGMNVKVIQPLTNKREKLLKSLERMRRDREGLSTHAYDATDDAIRMLSRKIPELERSSVMRRVVVVITDGFPVGDTVSPKTVIERANENETVIFALILPSFSRLRKSAKPLITPFELSGILEKTGGKSFYPSDNDFDAFFSALAEEITSSYALAFYPEESKRGDGKFHVVTIETRTGLKVTQNRAGYRIP